MSKKNRNLNYQLQFCLNDNFRIGFNKHADKHNPETDNGHIIKSVMSKDALGDFARNFTNWLKAEGYTNDIKMLKQIKPEHCQAFLDAKQKSGASQKTLECYQAYFRKFEKCIYATYGCRVDFSTTIDKTKTTTGHTIKEYSFTKEELAKIVDTKMCESLAVVKFNMATGSRIQMCEKMLCRDILITDDNKVVVFFNGDKGGRDRTITIDDSKFAEYCRQLRKGKNPNDRLFNVKKDSVNQWIYRRAKRLAILTPDGRVKSGNHSIRKNWAEQRQSTHGTKQTMKDLGHSEERKSLINTYTNSLK